MSDRTAAAIFGDIFARLASAGPTIDRDGFAKWLYGAAFAYDFHPSQMNKDAECIQLGVVKRDANGHADWDGES
jgi:hypothetical protein